MLEWIHKYYPGLINFGDSNKKTILSYAFDHGQNFFDQVLTLFIGNEKEIDSYYDPDIILERKITIKDKDNVFFEEKVSLEKALKNNYRICKMVLPPQFAYKEIYLLAKKQLDKILQRNQKLDDLIAIFQLQYMEALWNLAVTNKYEKQAWLIIHLIFCTLVSDIDESIPKVKLDTIFYKIWTNFIKWQHFKNTALYKEKILLSICKEIEQVNQSNSLIKTYKLNKLEELNRMLYNPLQPISSLNQLNKSLNAWNDNFRLGGGKNIVTNHFSFLAARKNAIFKEELNSNEKNCQAYIP